MRTLVALLFCVSVAAAQDPKKDEKKIEWKDLKAGPVAGKDNTVVAGSRIKITLRNGNTLRGIVVHPEYLKELNKKNWKPRAYDFEKVDTVVLDIGLEQPELGGYITLRRGDIKPPIIEMTPLDPATVEKLEKERERVRQQNQERLDEYLRLKAERDAADEEARRKAAKETETTEDPLEKKKREIEELQAAVQVYAKFPEGSAEDQQAGRAWGAERLKVIQQKTRALTPLTSEEQEFMSSYDQWVLGKKATEELKKEEKKEENP
jgi:hypothetical protein